MKIAFSYREQLRGAWSSASNALINGLDQLYSGITLGYHTEHNDDDTHKTIHATGTIAERGRTFAMGQWQPGPVATTTFTGSGAQTFAVGTFKTNVFAIVGQELRWYFRFEGCTVGGTHDFELRAALPLKTTAAFETETAIVVSDNGGTAQVGMARVVGHNQFVSFYVDATFATKWTLSAGTTIIAGQITIPIEPGI